MDKLTKTWKFIIANPDTIVALLVSAVATTFGIIQNNQGLLLAGIALTLTFLAASLIRDRLNRETLSEQIAELRKSLPDKPSATAFFRPMQGFDVRLKNATKIDLCGVSLTSMVSTYFATLRSRIEAGVELRILVIDPKSSAIEMTSERSTNPKDTMYYRRRLDSTFSDLTYLHKFAGDMKQRGRKGAKTGSLTVKLLSYAPSFSIVSLDSRDKEGLVQVEIFPHKFGFKARPVFTLSLDNDGEWYTYFVEQFEQMWNTATPWDPSPYMQDIPFDNVSS
jgi:hypothetical protein